jgi:hypothetical protein
MPTRGKDTLPVITRKASRLHHTRNLCAGFLLSLFVLGIAAAPTPKHEVFPFFCWFLFALTPGIEDNYELIITEYDGQAVTPPQSFMTSSLVTGRGAESSSNAHRIIEALGQAVVAGDADAIQAHRHMLEGNYFSKPVTYQIKKKIYDPLKYRRTGLAEESVIAIFPDGQPATSILNPKSLSPAP